jgi:hypothetical protein
MKPFIDVLMHFLAFLGIVFISVIVLYFIFRIQALAWLHGIEHYLQSKFKNQENDDNKEKE